MVGHCPDCDPILRASSIVCGECKAESFPVAAEFVSDDLILVTYDNTHVPYCAQRRSSGTVLIDATTDGGKFSWPVRPRACKGTVRSGNRRGQPCRNPPSRGTAYCAQHDPARQAAT